jgi:predicted DNA binding CopG/RHH family protein
MTKAKLSSNRSHKSKRPAKTMVLDLPQFKSEKEEGEFWDANPDLITAAMRAAYSPQRGKTQAVSIRVPLADLARIKSLAARKGIGYQTMAKVLLHEAVERAVRP